MRARLRGSRLGALCAICEDSQARYFFLCTEPLPPVRRGYFLAFFLILTRRFLASVSSTSKSSALLNRSLSLRKP